MKMKITMGQAEIRMQRAWKWFMRNEEGRWETFKRIRNRYRPHRLPLIARIELCLSGMSGKTPNQLSPDTQNVLEQNWNLCR